MDAGILEQVLYHIHNWFERKEIAVSDCQIVDGSLPASVSSELFDGVWYRIQGSYLNDGLHRLGEYDLNDETFSGTVTMLAVPKALLNLVDEIAEWVDDSRDADREARRSKYRSESFDGYSYSNKEDSRANKSSGGLTGWQAAFAGDLNPWRKMH